MLLEAALALLSAWLLARWLGTRARASDSPQALARARCVVTGGSQGLGSLLARELAARGACVALWDVDEEEGERAALSIRSAWPSSKACLVRCDVSSEESVSRALASTQRILGGPPTLLFNNAGVLCGLPVLECPPSSARRVFDVNLFGAINCCSAVLPSMISGGLECRIVNISSVTDHLSIPRMAAYCASKAALSSWSETLRLELEGTRVGLTVVHPYHITTRMFAGMRMPSFVERLLPSLEPAATARTIVRGVCDGASHIVLPRIMLALPLLHLLPTRLSSILARFMGIHSAMVGHTGRKLE